MPGSPRKGYYTILGVTPDATPEEIRSAYRLRARIVHPDRFDPVKQKADWENASEMLRELNEAFEVLSDPVRRADYDRASGGRTGSPRTPPPPGGSGATHEARQSANTARPAGAYVGAGRIHFSQLSPDLQALLRELEASGARSQFRKVFIRRPSTGVGLLLPLSWMAVVVSSWVGWTPALSALAVWGGGLAAALLSVPLWDHDLRGFRCQLRPAVYVTPLYMIRTAFDFVSFWPLYSLQGMPVGDELYGRLLVTLNFADTSVHMWLTLGQVFALQLAIRQNLALASDASASGDRAYFAKHDWFAGVDRSTQPPSHSPTPLHKRAAVWVSSCVVTLGALGVLVSYQGPVTSAVTARLNPDSARAVREAPSDTQDGAPSEENNASPDAAADDAVPSVGGEEADAEPAEAVRPPVSLPNGTRIVPSQGPKGRGELTIDNGTDRDAAVRMCILDEYGNREHYRFVYIKAHDSVNLIHIAPRTYDLIFCTGRDWDGTQMCFNEDCSYSKFDEPMAFEEEYTEEGVRYNTGQITLHPVPGGQAETSEISEEEFNAIQ